MKSIIIQVYNGIEGELILDNVEADDAHDKEFDRNIEVLRENLKQTFPSLKHLMASIIQAEKTRGYIVNFQIKNIYCNAFISDTN